MEPQMRALNVNHGGIACTQAKAEWFALGIPKMEVTIMPTLKIELSAEAERILPSLEQFCIRHDSEIPAFSIDLKAAAIAEQTGLIHRLIQQVKEDQWTSPRVKKDLNSLLTSISLQLKRAAAGRINATELTAASIAGGQPLPGGLRGVRVRR
jgi:hypothetical protein